MNSFLIAQGVGVVALLVAISIFQTNTRKAMLALVIAASLLWSAHFFLLGALTGSIMNLLTAGRTYIYYKVTPSKETRWILWFFIGLTTLAVALTWEGIISLLPFVGTMSGVIAFWQKKPKWIRRITMISPPAWFTYNAIVASYPGMVVEVLLLSSNLIGQYRFDFKKSKARKKFLSLSNPNG